MMAAATTMMTSRRHLTLSTVLVVLAVVSALAAAAPRLGKQYRVGGEDGWRVPPPPLENKDKYYDTWASNITFYVDDTLEFVYKNDSVLRVSKARYYHCNETVAGDVVAPRDGRTVFLLDAPGDAYFASADLQHCAMGERLAVTVLATAAGQPPAPSPTSAPGPWSWVLSPSSASSPSGEHSAAAAALVAKASSAHAAVVLVLVVAVALAAAGFV